MLIPHPILGPRDAEEFVYMGDARLLERPDGQADDAGAAFADHLYLRDNPAGRHRELWYHQDGDQSWLVVTRDTRTHEIVEVSLAREAVLARRALP